MAVGANGPAIHHRQPARGQRQYRNGVGRAITAGRLYARHGRAERLAWRHCRTSRPSPNLWPGYEASGTQGIGVPRKTPVEIIDKLNREINAGLYDSTMRARITNLGNTPLALSPAEYGKLLAQETEKWGKVVKFAGLKPD
jgi:hypothetical protein